MRKLLSISRLHREQKKNKSRNYTYYLYDTVERQKINISLQLFKKNKFCFFSY